MKWEYSILLAVVLIFPLALSFDKKLGIYRHWRALLVSVAGMSVPFWLWDIVGAARGHWSFNPSFTLGVAWQGLPIEEWLFFPIIGFVSIFTWESTKYFWKRRR